MKRKSLEDSLAMAELNEQERSFVEQAVEKPKLALVGQQSTAPVVSEAPQEALTPPDEEAVAKEKPKKERKPSAAPKEAQAQAVAMEPTISRSFRLSTAVADGLLDAAVKRKKLRLEPWSQEGLVNDILRDWLIENGYLEKR